MPFQNVVQLISRLDYNFVAPVIVAMLNSFSRQTALLAAISEKDANIALLELQSSSKGRKQEIKQLKQEKDKLVSELKEQVCLL